MYIEFILTVRGSAIVIINTTTNVVPTYLGYYEQWKLLMKFATSGNDSKYS